MATTHDEQRDTEIATRTERRYAAWTAGLAAKNLRAITDLQNLVLDHLSEVAAKDLFVQAIADPAAAGAKFAQLVAKVMYDECEADAMKEVEKIEAERAADFDEFDRSFVPVEGPWRHLAPA